MPTLQEEKGIKLQKKGELNALTFLLGIDCHRQVRGEIASQFFLSES